MDTIEELSNGFMNKINGIRERLQGKEGVDDIHDDENRIPKDDGNTLKPNATVQHNLRKRKPLKYYSEINRKDPCDKQFGADIKKSRKDQHSGYRQPVLRNTNDHHVISALYRWVVMPPLVVSISGSLSLESPALLAFGSFFSLGDGCWRSRVSQLTCENHCHSYSNY